MSGWPDDLRVMVPIFGAMLFFLIQTGLSVVLCTVSTLSRVALRRLSAESEGRLAFLEEMRELRSSRRTAIALARHLCLLGGSALLVLAAWESGWPSPAVAGLGLTALIAVIFLEFLVARALALWDPRRTLRCTAFLVRPAHLLLFPLVRPIHLLLTRVGRLQPINGEEREEEQDEEVEAYIEVGEREGILEANEGEMMRSIVDLDETLTREIMTPRADIVALSVDSTVEQARKAFLQAGHSRLPVYRGSLDEMVGVLHVRDLLLAADVSKGGGAVSRITRDAMIVSETLSVADLLSEMRCRTHIALVVDEYGGVSGLVTLEDLLEEIVGDIRDEHDLQEVEVREEGDGSWTIDAGAHVQELEGLFGIELGERDFDTVGGLVVSRLGRVPEAGETLEFQDLLIEVCKADRRRIRQVRVRRSGSAGKLRARP